jgi:hypothetical protein
LKTLEIPFADGIWKKNNDIDRKKKRTWKINFALQIRTGITTDAVLLETGSFG